MSRDKTQQGAACHKLLFVGAFPPEGSRVVGGNVSDCRALLESSFAKRFELALVDSTQPSSVASSLRERAPRAFARIGRFLRTFERMRPDAILVFASSGFSFLEKALFCTYARVRGVPSVLAIRSGHFLDRCRASPSFRRLASLMLRAPGKLLCQGEQWRRFFVSELGVNANRCVIVESWMATPPLLAIGESTPRRANSVLRLLFVGALEDKKGVFDLVEAIELLRADAVVPGFTLSLAGEGSALARLRTFLDEHALSGVVSLEGALDRQAMLEALKQADVFVLPSHTEGLPNSMVEAMAAGLPVVVTAVGSIPDVIVPDRNGILVPVGDPKVLAARLRELLTSAELRNSLGRSAHLTAAARFGTERAVESLSSAITDLIARDPSSRKADTRVSSMPS